jgi:hypothetical protein
MEATPPGEDLARVSEFSRSRRAAVLDEERIRAAAQLEVCLLHSGDAIPSFA